ncbi:MAG: tryptophan synthase subunit alpha [Synergistota bacterium]|nr:tryptophan synthase subunit alpha [Synergistota bacterium]
MGLFEKAFGKGRALVPFVTAGDPDLETTRSLVLALEEAGADIIELGVPFSDPQADGPVIQAAGQRALEAGTTLAKVLDLARELKNSVSTPLVLMGYYNPILNYGEDRFARDAAEAGVSGVIVPDLPFDEGENFYDILGMEGVDGILMAAPNSTEERLMEMGQRARGFVYCVSLMGITGQESGPCDRMGEYIDRVRKHVSIPLVLGFGIDNPARAARVAPLVDGVVVGSAIVRLVEKYGHDREKLSDEVKAFVASLKEAIKAWAGSHATEGPELKQVSMYTGITLDPHGYKGPYPRQG